VQDAEHDFGVRERWGVVAEFYQVSIRFCYSARLMFNLETFGFTKLVRALKGEQAGDHEHDILQQALQHVSQSYVHNEIVFICMLSVVRTISEAIKHADKPHVLHVTD
jgi:hypothetical protein